MQNFDMWLQELVFYEQERLRGGKVGAEKIRERENTEESGQRRGSYGHQAGLEAVCPWVSRFTSLSKVSSFAEKGCLLSFLFVWVT